MYFQLCFNSYLLNNILFVNDVRHWVVLGKEHGYRRWQPLSLSDVKSASASVPQVVVEDVFEHNFNHDVAASSITIDHIWDLINQVGAALQYIIRVGFQSVSNFDVDWIRRFLQGIIN